MKKTVCPNCSMEFNQKRSGRISECCSRRCAGSLKSKRKGIRVECAQCQRSLVVSIGRLVKKKNSFCSVPCQKTFFKTNPPRKAEGFWYENGYRVLWLGNGRFKKEHIHVMERKIGRPLRRDEVVHHVNRVRDDNRLENLQLMTRSEHTSIHRKDEVK